jgi:hypothetical protein
MVATLAPGWVGICVRVSGCVELVACQQPPAAVVDRTSSDRLQQIAQTLDDWLWHILELS